MKEIKEFVLPNIASKLELYALCSKFKKNPSEIRNWEATDVDEFIVIMSEEVRQEKLKGASKSGGKIGNSNKNKNWVKL